MPPGRACSPGKTTDHQQRRRRPHPLSVHTHAPSYATRYPHGLRRPSTLVPSLLCPKHASRPQSRPSTAANAGSVVVLERVPACLVTHTTAVPAAVRPLRLDAYHLLFPVRQTRGPRQIKAHTHPARQPYAHLLRPVSALFSGPGHFSRTLAATPFVPSSARRRLFPSSCQLTVLNIARLALRSRPMALPIS